MDGTERWDSNPQKLIVETEGLIEIPLLKVRLACVVDCCCDVEMINAQDHLSDPQCLFICQESIIVVPIHVVNSTDIIQCGCHVAMRITEFLSSNR